MPFLQLRSQGLIEESVHNTPNQHERTVLPESSHLTDTPIVHLPDAVVCLSESVPFNSGTPVISSKKETNTNSYRTPCSGSLKTSVSELIDENQSPNRCPAYTSTPNSVCAAPSPELTFKNSVGQVRSLLAQSDSSTGHICLRGSEADASPGHSDSVGRLSRQSQPLVDDYSTETAQTSFGTARTYSASPSVSPLKQQNSSRISQAPEFTTPSESFEVYEVDLGPANGNIPSQFSSAALAERLKLESQVRAKQFLMDDVSMMSIDGNASFDVRDPGIKAVPITSETASADSENRTETISLNSSAVTTEKNGENFAPFENAPVSSGKNAYTVDDTLTPAAPVEPKERTSMGSSNHSVTPTPETDDVRKSAQLSESHSVYKAVESLNSAPESSTSESTSGSRLNGTFDKTPNKSNPDPLSGGDGLAVVLSTSGHGTPESKLNGTFDKNKSALDVNLPECPAEDCAATCSSRKLNDTFDKSPSEPSPHNGTFDKETSSLVVGDLTRTPELELRLDQTCQTEEVLDPTLESPRGEQQQNRMCSEAKTLLATPDKGEMAGRTQSTPRLTRRRASAHGGNTAREQIKAKEDDDKEDSAKSTGQRRSSGGSFLKRRCSILELSFVSSPKRANYQLNTPKGVRDSRRSGPTLLHESIAFDFSAAVATAQKNNGVAEMGSFVFAASSGQPVASDAFDLSALEKIDTSAKTNAEKYTRVSFIAMFDPIKPNSPTHDKLEEKTLAEPSGRSTESTDFKTPLAHVGSNFNISPLVKGLPTPIFAKPKAFTAATQTVAVQTESLQEAKSVTSEPQTPEINFDEVTACVADLNRLVENQQNALNAYEKVVALLKDRIVDASSNDELDKKPDSEEVSRLKESLVAERDRNAQQDEVVRNLERSMHSTLKRMAECRESNAVLTKVVEEQLAAMSLTRANCEALEHHMNEMLANAKDEIRVLKEKAQEDERSHKKALSKFDLQLKAKESELEYSQSQLAIAKKEIDSLRKLVEQMNLQ